MVPQRAHTSRRLWVAPRNTLPEIALISTNGWGVENQTPIRGFKVHCLIIRRHPNDDIISPYCQIFIVWQCPT